MRLTFKSKFTAFTYLGLPLGFLVSSKKNWKPLIDKVTNQLSVWKEKTLLIGWRITLLILVLGSLLVYYMSLFRAPIYVINTLEQIRRNFCWSMTGDKKKVC